jgi:hypothetical protein
MSHSSPTLTSTSKCLSGGAFRQFQGIVGIKRKSVCREARDRRISDIRARAGFEGPGEHSRVRCCQWPVSTSTFRCELVFAKRRYDSLCAANRAETLCQTNVRPIGSPIQLQADAPADCFFKIAENSSPLDSLKVTLIGELPKLVPIASILYTPEAVKLRSVDFSVDYVSVCFRTSCARRV